MDREKEISVVIGGDFAPVGVAEEIAINNPTQVWGDSVDLF